MSEQKSRDTDAPLVDEWQRAVANRKAHERRRLLAIAVGTLTGIVVTAFVVLGVLYGIWTATSERGVSFWHDLGNMESGGARITGASMRGLGVLSVPGILVGMFVYRRVRAMP
jgi:hypothetical protein